MMEQNAIHGFGAQCAEWIEEQMMSCLAAIERILIAHSVEFYNNESGSIVVLEQVMNVLTKKWSSIEVVFTDRTTMSEVRAWIGY